MDSDGTGRKNDLVALAHLGVRTHTYIHRLDQAMTAVVGYAQLAADIPSTDPGGHRAIGRLLHASRCASDLVRELAVAASGPNADGACCVPLSGIVEEACRGIGSVLGSSIHVSDRHVTPSVWALGSAEALLRLVTGLLLMGADAVGDSGRLTLETRAPLCPTAEETMARLALTAVPLAPESPCRTRPWEGRRPAPPPWLCSCLDLCHAQVGVWQQDAGGMAVEVLLPAVWPGRQQRTARPLDHPEAADASARISTGSGGLSPLARPNATGPACPTKETP